MAKAEKNAIIEVPFGIMNMKGLMPIQKYDEKTDYCRRPVFAHESYPITCTLNSNIDPSFGKLHYLKYSESTKEQYPLEGQSYQKQYRKNVRWSFGDGTEIDGFTATHYYTIPGKYTITCTFFDVDRKGVINNYEIQVIVKQIIPTMISFDNTVEDMALKRTVNCSATEQIATIEALLSNNVKNDVDIIAKRIWQANEEEEPHWDDVKKLTYPHLRRYWTFINNKKEYINETERLWDEKLTPCDRYSPEYETIYGKFILDDDNKIVFDAYYVSPYRNTQVLRSMKMLDPECDIDVEEDFTEMKIHPLSVNEEIPEGCTLAGKRGVVEVYYRSDFLNEKNVLSFYYDVDNMKLTNSIDTSSNWMNMMPLGMHFGVVKNNKDFIDFSLTLNGFVTSYERVDKLVQLSLLKNYDFTAILIPYIKYDTINCYIHELTEDPLLMEHQNLIFSEYNVEDYFIGDYYIPKDFLFSEIFLQMYYGEWNDCIIESEPYDGVDYLRAFKIILKEVLDAQFTVGNKTIDLKYDLYDLDKEIVPTEKLYKQDIDKLIDVYTPHPLFDDAHNLKGMLSNLFKTNNMLNYVLTKGKNFFDDNVNIKTNYVENLLQTLTMMGQDISEYSTTNFEGVNELKDLTRILSMNHSELMGNYIDEPYDIKITSASKGKHIGERVYVNDVLYALTDNLFVGDKRFYKGKVTKIQREVNGKTVTYTTKEPVALVMVDDYSKESRIISFSDIPPREVTEDGEAIYSIIDYEESWGWNLLLPNEWQREDKAKIIDSYYSFYLLVPPLQKDRVGNFVDADTITDDMLDPDKWSQMDGITFRQLQKVIHSKL